MLTPQEKDYIKYWERNRDKQKKVFRQFLVGIPIGFLFVIPIVINFASGWYKRAAMEANTSDFSPGVLLVALLLIVGFTAIFSKRHQWDLREQRYQELMVRNREENSGDQPVSQPESQSGMYAEKPSQAAPEASQKPGQTQQKGGSK